MSSRKVAPEPDVDTAQQRGSGNILRRIRNGLNFLAAAKSDSGLPIEHSAEVDGDPVDDPSHHRHFHFHRLSSKSLTYETEDRLEAVEQMEDEVRDLREQSMPEGSKSNRRSSNRSSNRSTRGSTLKERSVPPTVLESPRPPAAGTPEAQPPAAGGTPDDSAGDARPPPTLAEGPTPKGWTGSEHDKPLIDGIYEHRQALAERRRFRLLPEINNLVSQLWRIGVKRGVRMSLKEYMDFHLSCCFFVTAIEEDCDVADLSYDSIDLYDGNSTIKASNYPA